MVPFKPNLFCRRSFAAPAAAFLLREFGNSQFDLWLEEKLAVDFILPGVDVLKTSVNVAVFHQLTLLEVVSGRLGGGRFGKRLSHFKYKNYSFK